MTAVAKSAPSSSLRLKFVSVYVLGMFLPAVLCLTLLYWLALAPAV